MPEDLEGGKVGCGLAEIGVKSKIKSTRTACELSLTLFGPAKNKNVGRSCT